MATHKFAISFEEELAEHVVRAAEEQTGGNVSAWLAEAARERLRKVEASKLLQELEADHGQVTDEEIAEVRRRWPRA